MGDEGRNSRIADVPATQADPIYGIGDVVALTGISAFSEADVAQLHLVEALRKSGLSIEGIQYFVRLCRRGDTTRAERLSILRAQETVLEYQREELDESLKRLHAATVDLEAAERSQEHGML